MFKWGIGAAAAALAMPFAGGQADAQVSWYGTGAVTYSDVDSADTIITNRLPTGNLVASFNTETGFGGHGALGVYMGQMRAEAEIGVSRNDFESYRANGTATTIPMTGDVKIARVMGNAYLDFDVAGGSFVPYLGLGVGGANIDVEATAALPTAPTGPQVTLINDDQTNLAWQAMAGFSVPLGDRFAFTLQYRYFKGGTLDGQDTTGHAYHMDITSGNVDLGVRVKF